MKKALILAPLAFILFLFSCEKIDQLLTFYIDDTQNITIPANFPIGSLGVLAPIPVTTRSDETFRNNNTAADKVKDVSLNKLTLSITDPAGQNFDFLQSIELFISTDANDQVRLAYLDQVPRGVSSIELTSTNAKLDKYLKAATYTLTTKAQLAQPISRNVTVKAESRFKVTADPL
jgi:hypothetical protein